MGWKRALLAASLVFLAVMVAAYLFLSVYDFNTLKPTISQAVKNATGWDLVLDGDLELRVVGLALGLSVEGVRFKNPPRGSRKDLATIGRGEGQIAVLALLFGRIELRRLIFIEPDILLETDDSGRFNLVFEPVRKPEAKELTGQGKVPDFPLREIRFEKGRIAYRDGRSGRTFEMGLRRLKIAASGTESPIELSLRGLLNDKPFEVGGTLGSLTALTQPNQPWPVSVRFRGGGADARLEGEIRDVSALEGLALTLTARGKSTSDLLEMAGLKTPPDLGPFAALIKLADTGGDLSAEELDLQIGKKDLVEVGIHGSIRDVLSLRGIDLTLAVEGEYLSKLQKPLGRPLPLKGPFVVSGKVVDPEDKTYSLTDLKGTFGSNEINGWMQLNLGGNRSRVLAELRSQRLDLRSVLISETNLPFIAKLPRLGPIELGITVSDPFGKLGVEDLNLRLGTSDLVSIGITGFIQNPITLRGIKLSFEVEGKDLANLEELVHTTLPFKGPFSLSGQITDPADRNYRFENLEAVLGRNQLHGTVNIDLVDKESKLRASLSSPQFDLREVASSEIARLPWLETFSHLGPIRIVTTLSAPAGKLAVKELELEIGTENLVKAKIMGSIDDPRYLRGLKLSFAIEGKDLVNLEKLLGRPWPLRGAFRVHGQLSDSEDKVYSFTDIKAMFERNEMDGSVELDLVGEKPNLRVAVSSKTLDLKSSLASNLSKSPWIEALSDLGPVRMIVTISDPGGEVKVEQLNLELGTEDLAEVRINGAIHNPMTMGGIDLTVAMRGRDFGNLQKLLGPLPPFEGPFAVSVRVVDLAKSSYKISDLEGIIGNNDLRGRVELNLAGQRSQVTAELSSERIDLRPIFAREKIDSTKDIEPDEPKPKEPRVFPREPLPLNVLTRVDLNLRLQTERFLLPRWALGDLTLDFSLAKGHLVANSLSCKVGGGAADGNLDLRVEGKEIDLSTNLVISQLDLGPMIEEVGVEPFINGTISAEIELSSRGDSVAALMAGLTGKTTLVVRQGWFNNSYVSLVGSNIISQMLQLVNPGSQKEKRTEFTCHVNHFDITDGLAKCRVWVSDTKHTRVIGGGKINLKTEGLNLAFKLSPKKGIGHSSVGKVSVSLGKLATMVKIGGTLADPSLVINPTGIGVTVGKALGGMLLLGPLGLGAALIDVSPGDKDPCATAIEAAQKGVEITYDKEERKEKESTR